MNKLSLSLTIVGITMLFGVSIMLFIFSALIKTSYDEIEHNWYNGEIIVTKNDELIADDQYLYGDIYVDGLVQLRDNSTFLKLHVIYPPKPQFLYNIYNQNSLTWYNNLVLQGLNKVKVNPLPIDDVYEAVTNLPLIHNFGVYLGLGIGLFIIIGGLIILIVVLHKKSII